MTANNWNFIYFDPICNGYRIKEEACRSLLKTEDKWTLWSMIAIYHINFITLNLLLRVSGCRIFFICSWWDHWILKASYYFDNNNLEFSLPPINTCYCSTILYYAILHSSIAATHPFCAQKHLLVMKQIAEVEAFLENSSTVWRRTQNLPQIYLTIIIIIIILLLIITIIIIKRSDQRSEGRWMACKVDLYLCEENSPNRWSVLYWYWKLVIKWWLLVIHYSRRIAKLSNTIQLTDKSRKKVSKTSSSISACSSTQ